MKTGKNVPLMETGKNVLLMQSWKNVPLMKDLKWDMWSIYEFFKKSFL